MSRGHASGRLADHGCGVDAQALRPCGQPARARFDLGLARIERGFALVRQSLALVSKQLAFIGKPVTLIRDQSASTGGAVAIFGMASEIIRGLDSLTGRRRLLCVAIDARLRRITRSTDRAPIHLRASYVCPLASQTRHLAVYSLKALAACRYTRAPAKLAAIGGTAMHLATRAATSTITDHQYVTPAKDGMHITVTDLNTHHSGTIVLNSKVDGPLMPAFSVQKLGNSLGWGLVNDAPNSLVWEIGHTGSFTTPAAQLCLPGETGKNPCFSYNVPTWLNFAPLQIKGVTFASGGSAGHFAVVSDFGGAAEVDQDCGAANYGQPFCTYPWYAFNGADSAFTYGDDYPGTTQDFGQVVQFQQQRGCASPADGAPQYCSTQLK